MAFSQNTAADTDTLMGDISTFLQANGYTLIRSREEVCNGLSVLTVTLQCPDGTYITFMSTNTYERPWPSVGILDNDYILHPWLGDPTARDAFEGRYLNTFFGEDLSSFGKPFLGAIRHITYDVTKNWYDQPDCKRLHRDDIGGYYGDTENKNIYSCIVSGANVNYFLYRNTNPECVHIVTEYESGKYSHMTIGNLEKSHNYVGGEYIQGSVGGIDARNGYMGYLPWSIIELEASEDVRRTYGAMRCEGNGNAFYTAETTDSMKGWGRCLHITGIHVSADSFGIPLEWNGANIDNVYTHDLSRYTLGIPLAQGVATDWNTSEDQRHLDGNNWLGSTFDSRTGQPAPIALTGWCEHEVAGAVYLGSWVHVGVIMMSGFSGKEEFTLGGNTYQVFPLNNLNALGTDGVATTTPPDLPFVKNLTRDPEYNLYNLGLAIRKVV